MLYRCEIKLNKNKSVTSLLVQSNLKAMPSLIVSNPLFGFWIVSSSLILSFISSKFVSDGKLQIIDINWHIHMFIDIVPRAHNSALSRITVRATYLAFVVSTVLTLFIRWDLNSTASSCIICHEAINVS